MAKIKTEIDFTRKYGHWTPLREQRLPPTAGQLERGHAGNRGVVCRCDCGRESLVSKAALLNGISTQCKWCRAAISAPIAGRVSPGRFTETHGLRDNPLYSVWFNMISRCENPDNAWYHRYGGRGITVCPRWHDVTAFVTDIEATIGPRPPGMSIDRKNNNGNYEAGNVKWSTPAEQRANQGDPDD